MRPYSPHGVESRRSRPTVEGLESRDLPSQLALGTGAAHGTLPDPAVIQQAVNLLYGPNSLTPMTPTNQEIHRQTFIARWAGQYTVGAPRFSDRASTIHFYSPSGGSNQFQSGKFQMVLFPPANPNATPTPGNPYANQTTGVAGLFTKNFLQSGNLLVLDLIGASGSGSGAANLPTHLSWTYDGDSAGLYAAPGQFTQGTGVIDIHYIPDAVPRTGTLGSGRMIVTIQGLINLGQVTNPLSKVYM
jgi:hypothetical protein